MWIEVSFKASHNLAILYGVDSVRTLLQPCAARYDGVKLSILAETAYLSIQIIGDVFYFGCSVIGSDTIYS